MRSRQIYMPTGIRRNLDNEMLQKLVPSVFAEQPFGETSSRYSFIPTIQFAEKLKDRGWIPVNAREQRVLNDERQGYQKHIIRFQHENNMAAAKNDIVPEIILTNSHDARSSFKLMAGMFRLVCTNGLVIADAKLASVTIRHSGYTDKVVNEASDHMLEGIPRMISGIDKYRDVELLPQEAEIFAASAAMVRWNKETTEELPVAPVVLLQRRRNSDNANTLWNTFNVIQENLTKGGYRMKPKPEPENQRRSFYRQNRGRRARAINSINEDIRMNRALWNLTEKMRELKEEGNTVLCPIAE